MHGMCVLSSVNGVHGICVLSCVNGMHGTDAIVCSVCTHMGSSAAEALAALCTEALAALCTGPDAGSSCHCVCSRMHGIPEHRRPAGEGITQPCADMAAGPRSRPK
eukprot:364646-Chlamydomonas_euryale.AAC.2